MLFQEIKHAYRTLSRDRFYSLLNATGLAVGMATTLLIFLWVHSETTYDQFHDKGHRIYRILNTWTFGGKEETMSMSPAPLAEKAINEIPEIQKMARIWEPWNVVLHHGEQMIQVPDTYLADPDFFEIFDFPAIDGNPAKTLNDPGSAVLTNRLALRIFGTTDVIGQPLKLADKLDLTVGAVIEDPPSNSHLDFDLVIPFQNNIEKFVGQGSLHWNAYNFKSYVLLRPGILPDEVGEKLTMLAPVEEGETRMSFFRLQGLYDVYLGSGWLAFSDTPRGNVRSIKLITLIGIFILLIACINYINMTTARQSHRAKDTGIRKIIGARRGQLFRQFLIEALILVVLSALCALVIAQLSLGFFENLTGKQFSDGQLYGQIPLLILTGTVIFTVLFSGIQPALQLSAFKPMQALGGNTWSGDAKSSGFRKLLVISQFACSGALIICVLVITSQLNFVRNYELGYNRDHIFSFYCMDSDPLKLMPQLRQEPSIIDVTASSSSIVDLGNRYGGFDYEGKDPETDPYIWMLGIHNNFQTFFGLETKEGHWLRPEGIDTNSYIINESAVSALSIEDPVGKWMDINGTKGRITGVARDFHFKSLHHPIEQLIFKNEPDYLRHVYVKTSGEHAMAAIAATESETRTGRLFSLFAFMAIFISCLGIFGLATFAAERRQREVSIRKILGASVGRLIFLLSRGFLGLVTIAVLIGSPIAWYFMHEWLQSFSYHIEIKPWIFLSAFGIAVSIAFITVSFQSTKTALMNPAKTLHND